MKHTLLALLIFALLTSCAPETTTIEDTYNGDLHKVTKIEVLDGNTGDSTSTKEINQIETFINEIKDVRFIPDNDQSKRDGFHYSITFYQGEEQKFQFGVNQIDDRYYYTDPDIKPIVEQFYKSLQSK